MEQLQALGTRLLQGQDALRWPDAAVQARYTGTSGETLLAKSIEFVQLLARQVPVLREGGAWRGLEYGVGWGRLASLMTRYGGPDQLDCADAWEQSLAHARSCGLTNRMLHVGASVGPDEFEADAYDFIYAYSIFTHLPAALTANNLARLHAALKPGGVLLFTVRDPNFLDFLRKIEDYKPVVDGLDSIGYWFGNINSRNNLDYGDSVFTRAWLRRETQRLGPLQALGALKLEPTQIVMKLAKAPRPAG
jgi:SAM-dependent methyltransferase